MFDATEDLLERIRLGEDNALELTAVHWAGDRIRGPRRDALADELAAMANTDDGVCVLGVDDATRDVLGIPVDRLDQVETFVRELCQDTCDPPLQVRIYRLRLPDTLGELRPVMKIEVPRSLFVHRSPGGYLHRVGSSKRQMPPQVLARLFQQRSQARLIRFDEQAVPESTFADLDPDLWGRLVDPATEDPIRTLHKRKVLTFDDGRERATVTGVLTCAQRPDRWLPGASARAVRFRGTVQDSNQQVDAADITGPVERPRATGCRSSCARPARCAAWTRCGGCWTRPR